MPNFKYGGADNMCFFRFAKVLVTMSLFIFCVHPTASRAGDSSDWNRFEIKGTKLGMTPKQLVTLGFKTCNPGDYPPSYSNTGDSHPYFKILDKRCDKSSGNKCEVKFDGDCRIFYNGQSAKNPSPSALEYMVALASTDTDQPRVYDITYYFPQQFIGSNTPFGKTLIGKYGKTCTDTAECDDAKIGIGKSGGGMMIWQRPGDSSHNPYLRVDCKTQTLYDKDLDLCVMNTEDPSILMQDRKSQSERDLKKNKANHAAPPSL